MPRRSWLWAHLPLALWLVAVQAHAAEDPVIARLNGHDVRWSEIRPLLAGLDPASRNQAAKNPEALAGIVRADLGQIALADEARQKQWDQQPEVQKLVRQAVNSAIASSYLAASASLPAGYPSDAQIDDAYDKNRDKFLVPRQYHLAQIFMLSSAGASPAETERKARDLASRAKSKPGDFLELAVQSGAGKDDGSGDLGWNSDNRIVPEVLTVVQGMAEGDISEPIRTAAGWHIVALLGTRPACIRPLGEVRDTLVTWLRQKRKQEEEKRFVDQLLIKDQAAINEIALKQAIEQANDK